MRQVRKIVALVVGASLAGLLSHPAPAQNRRPAAKPAPAPAGQPVDLEVQAALAIANRQPVSLDLVRSDLEWIKQCPDPQVPSKCIVNGGFALGSGVPPTVEMAVRTASNAGTHLMDVLVPLDLQLQPGFAVTFGGSQAFVGKYTVCRSAGCFGEVVLTDRAYGELLKAKTIGIVVSNTTGRTVELKGPLDGLAETISGPALTREEVVAARDRAQKRFEAAVEERRVAADAAATAALSNSPPALPAGEPPATAQPNAQAAKPSGEPATDKP